jgi:hypothetical protein
MMGEQTWKSSGLGVPDDIDQLHHRITVLEAEVADVQIQLGERADELNAAHPWRFVRKPPEPLTIPTVAWINEPQEVPATTQ